MTADWCTDRRGVSVGAVRTSEPIVLTVLGDPELSDSTNRVIAAVGLRSVRAQDPSRQSWPTAAAVVVDEDGARRCVHAGMQRREAIFMVGSAEPTAAMWAAAVEIGAERLCVLPVQEAELVRCLSEAAEAGRIAPRLGRVIAVTAGRGGGGASVFAAALGQCAGEGLLVDLDPCGGGLDLLLGVESSTGLRWPDLAIQSGRLSWTAVREVLPQLRELSVLSGTRTFHEIDAGAAASIVDAGRRGGATVVCDLPRQPTSSSLRVLETADLAVIVTSCDVRGIAATAAVASVIRTVNPNVGLVVRGPAPGGLRAGEIVDIATAPLLAAMRPEPMLAVQLEHGGLRMRRRSPLAAAARTVLRVLQDDPAVRAA
jgi:secretion/DNA translocation related CpaE-like protein